MSCFAHLLEALWNGGLACGRRVARPDILEKIRPYSAGAMPITAVVGANASLKVKNLVSERRKIMGDVREDTFSWLTKKNVEFIPSESNCFMINTKRSGKEFYAAMASQKVFIGRVWPVLAGMGAGYDRHQRPDDQIQGSFHQSL